jgi:hypothetical protein
MQQALRENEATLDSETRPFEPPEEEAVDYTVAAFEPLIIIAGAAALGYLARAIAGAIKDAKHGGAVADLRDGKLNIRSSPAIPGGTVVVVTDDNVLSLSSPPPQQLEQLIVSHLQE